MRAHGILLSHQGFSIKRIAAVYQVSRQAVSAWLERWQQAGLIGLYDHPRSGRPPRLSVAAQQQVEH
jgi:transposase